MIIKYQNAGLDAFVDTMGLRSAQIQRDQDGKACVVHLYYDGYHTTFGCSDEKTAMEFYEKVLEAREEDYK